MKQFHWLWVIIRYFSKQTIPPMNNKQQGQRWKKLANPDLQSSLLQTSRSRSKNKKFTPIRQNSASNLPGLDERIRVVRDGKKIGINFHEKISDSSFVDQQTPVKQNHKGVMDKQSVIMSQSSLGGINQIRKRVSSVTKQGQELIPLTPCLKQLMQLNKKQINDKLARPLLFAPPDKPSQFVYEQLKKVKEEYTRFKQIVQEQLVRQYKYIKNVVSQIYKEMENVLKAYGSENSQRNIDFLQHQMSAKQRIQEIHFTGLNTIKKFDSMYESRSQIKRQLNQDVLKLQLQFSRPPPHCFTDRQFVKYQPMPSFLKSPRSQQGSIIRSQHHHRVDHSPRRVKKHQSTNSKKQFMKLFDAVNNLKRDIKDMKDLSLTAIRQQPVHQHQQQQQHKESPLSGRGLKLSLERLRS